MQNILLGARLQTMFPTRLQKNCHGASFRTGRPDQTELTICLSTYQPDDLEITSLPLTDDLEITSLPLTLYLSVYLLYPRAMWVRKNEPYMLAWNKSFLDDLELTCLSTYHPDGFKMTSLPCVFFIVASAAVFDGHESISHLCDGFGWILSNKINESWNPNRTQSDANCKIFFLLKDRALALPNMLPSLSFANYDR